MGKAWNTLCVLIDDEVVAATVAAPTDATDGVPVPELLRRNATLLVEKSAASGTRTYQGTVYGYMPGKQEVTEAGVGDPTYAKKATSGAWFPLFTTDAESNAADFNKPYPLTPYLLMGFTRFAHEVLANGGTTPVLTTSVLFAGEDR